MEADRLCEPENIGYVQKTLRDAANRRLNTRNIEKVLLTDFIAQAK